MKHRRLDALGRDLELDQVVNNAQRLRTPGSVNSFISEVGRFDDEGESAGLDVAAMVERRQAHRPIVFYTHRILDRVTLDGRLGRSRTNRVAPSRHSIDRRTSA